MAHTYGDDDVEDTNEEYNESDDQDFNPDSAPAEDLSSSDEDEDVLVKSTPRKGKRKAAVNDEPELDSGDEVTIQAARKRKAKKKKKGAKDDDGDDLLFSDDEGGEGGLIKTRAQRQVEKKERRPLARTEGATVDVDALWAQMMAAPLQPQQPVQPVEAATSQPQAAAAATTVKADVIEEEQISIKKTYTFAGQDTTEEKQIPRSQLDTYLSQGWKTSDAPSKEDTPADTTSSPKANTSKIRRPLRRPTRFDPNPTGYVRALAPEYQLTYPRKATTTSTSLLPNQENTLMPPPELPRARPEKTQKLNVVDKSRMDWTGFVDKEGIAEELDTHGKTKEAYLGRMQFLAGVEARREEERKRVKSVAGAT